MRNEIKIENGLGFKLNTDSGQLLAIVMPCDEKVDLTVEMVKQRLEKVQLRNLFTNDILIFELVHRYNHNHDETFEMQIGERRDATAELFVSENKMKATLALTANFGGNPITLEDVQKLLEIKNIIWGVVPNETIEAALAKQRSVDLVIAKGLDPIAGIDAQFQNLMRVDTHEHKPLIHEDGSVDYRELGDIFMVHKGDVLMRRIPAIPGTKGCNVFGEIINPTGGADIPFSADKKGIFLNPEDENQLLSALTGQPILVPNGIVVLSVLTVKNVDFSSGNVRFDGSVVVLGDVETGMKVYALEDITIDGSVADAQIECMGNLLVKGSVTGNSQLIANGNVVVKGGIQGFQEQVIDSMSEDEACGSTNTAKIITHGSASVGFAENFSIEAGVDIVVEKYAMNCYLMAENKIVTGAKNSGKKSSILGGMTWAMMLVKGTILGANSGIKTVIQVGSNPYLQKRVTTIKNTIIANAKKQEDIEKILGFISVHPKKGDPEMLEKLHHNLSKLVIEENMNRCQLKELVSNMAIIEDAKVIAERGVYTGTEIKINRVLWVAQENRGKSVFRVENREMTINVR
ncbi:MAG: FapA family protein [Methylococcaceae bacterium]